LRGAEGRQHHGNGHLNRQAKAAAHPRSVHSNAFNHLITAMKCPTPIRAIEPISRGRAAIVQLVSTPRR
jgi:hypothetical protein